MGAGAREAPLPADQAFVLSHKRAADGSLKLSWKIRKGYYLYREHMDAEDAAGQSLLIETPGGQMKADPTFGTVEVYYGRARARIAHRGAVRLTYRGCQADGLCYLPVRVTIPGG